MWVLRWLRNVLSKRRQLYFTYFWSDSQRPQSGRKMKNLSIPLKRAYVMGARVARKILQSAGGMDVLVRLLGLKKPKGADERYLPEFLAYDQAGSRASAREILPLVIDVVKPRTAIDVGCGVGTWAAELLR